MAAFLSFNKIGKKINNVNLLADLSFGIQKGEILFILGKTNSGKSTLFKILMGFVNKDKGQIFVDGMDYDIRKNKILSNIGYMPQKNIFDNNLNVYENLSFFSELQGLRKVDINEKIKYWADRLNFKKYLFDQIDLISDSVLKKISFSRSLIHNPEILLFDDPTSYMDYYDQNIIFEVMQEIKMTKSILFITQDFKIAELYSDRVVIISNGKVEFNGTIQNVEESMNDIYKYRFSFKRIVPSEFLKIIRENKDINKIISRDNNVEIRVKDKKVFFDVFKLAVNYELQDVKMSSSKLTDLFERII